MDTGGIGEDGPEEKTVDDLALYSVPTVRGGGILNIPYEGPNKRYVQRHKGVLYMTGGGAIPYEAAGTVSEYGHGTVCPLISPPKREQADRREAKEIRGS